MKTVNFPYLALALGLFLLLVITRGSEADTNGVTALPLLTLLIINECGFILTAAGVYIGLKQLKTGGLGFKQNPLYSMTIILCILMAIAFTLLGIKLWPL